MNIKKEKKQKNKAYMKEAQFSAPKMSIFIEKNNNN